MSHHETSPAEPPGDKRPKPGKLPINTDEQPSGRASGPLQSADEKRKAERDTLVPPAQPEDNDV